MAERKCLAVNDATLPLCPGTPIRICRTWIPGGWDIWTSGRNFPAVTKLQDISYYRLAPGGEIIDVIAVIVSTKATDLTLHREKYKTN